MPDDLKSKCAAVIHTATTAAAAACYPDSYDTIPSPVLKMTMIMGSLKVFDIPHDTGYRSIHSWWYDGQSGGSCNFLQHH